MSADSVPAWGKWGLGISGTLGFVSVQGFGISGILGSFAVQGLGILGFGFKVC